MTHVSKVKKSAMCACLIVGLFLNHFAYAYTNYGYGSNPYSTNVDGYVRRDGTYVNPYQRTIPNHSDYDNYGARGNYNPNSGSYGTRSPRRY